MSEKNYSKIYAWLKADFNEKALDHIKDELINILITGKSLSEDLYNLYFREIAYIVHKFSQKPWTTQKSIIEKLGIKKEILIKINSILRDNPIIVER